MKRAQSLAMMACPVYNVDNEWWKKVLKLEKDLKNYVMNLSN
jgi:hypothetical protein